MRLAGIVWIVGRSYCLWLDNSGSLYRLFTGTPVTNKNIPAGIARINDENGALPPTSHNSRKQFTVRSAGDRTV